MPGVKINEETTKSRRFNTKNLLTALRWRRKKISAHLRAGKGGTKLNSSMLTRIRPAETSEFSAETSGFFLTEKIILKNVSCYFFLIFFPQLFFLLFLPFFCSFFCRAVFDGPWAVFPPPCYVNNQLKSSPGRGFELWTSQLPTLFSTIVR